MGLNPGLLRKLDKGANVAEGLCPPPGVTVLLSGPPAGLGGGVPGSTNEFFKVNLEATDWEADFQAPCSDTPTAAPLPPPGRGRASRAPYR